jgi:hypothetical protein
MPYTANISLSIDSTVNLRFELFEASHVLFNTGVDAVVYLDEYNQTGMSIIIIIMHYPCRRIEAA